MRNRIFGHLESGEPVERIRLIGGGLTAHVLTWGSVIQDLRLAGHEAPLVLGYEDLPSYLAHSPYFGATPGRCANRIAGGRFAIDGAAYQLECNERGVTASAWWQRRHGPAELAHYGSGRRFRHADRHRSRRPRRLSGTAALTCTYRLAGDGVLSVVYEATADHLDARQSLPAQLFQPRRQRRAFGHEIRLAADHYLPVDDKLIPTGEVRSRSRHTLRPSGLDAASPADGGGRHRLRPQFLPFAGAAGERPVGAVRSPASGVSLEVLTTEPGVQLYTGGYVNSPVPGLDGRRYGPFAGFCLETQIWPDAVNHDHFPKAVLRPGETLRQETDYVFRKD